jgi:hypothetical protein
MRSFSKLAAAAADNNNGGNKRSDHVSIWSGEKIIKSRANLSPFARRVHDEW